MSGNRCLLMCPNGLRFFNAKSMGKTKKFKRGFRIDKSAWDILSVPVSVPEDCFVAARTSPNRSNGV